MGFGISGPGKSNERARVSKDEEEHDGRDFGQTKPTVAPGRPGSVLVGPTCGCRKRSPAAFHCFRLLFTMNSATPTCRYCFGMPARSITAAHLPMSPASRAFNSSGVLALASI